MKYKVDDLTAIRDETNAMVVRLLPVNCSKRECAKLTILLCQSMNKELQSTDA